MEGCLRNMRNLRALMNEFEEEAVSLSMEERQQKLAIEATEKDLESVRSETKRLNEVADEMTKAKIQISCQILEKQKKAFSLEIESTNLSQASELLQKETISLQEKLKEHRNYYEKIREELNSKLLDKEECVSSQKLKTMTSNVSAQEIVGNQTCLSEGSPRSEHPSTEGMKEDVYEDLKNQLETGRRKLEELKAKTSEISLQNIKSQDCISELEVKVEAFPPELKAMDAKFLEKEHQALLVDKAGELEYLQSLKERIHQLQDVSEMVKCQCGEEYKVELKN